MMSVGEATVLACDGHVYAGDGFRRLRCVKCGLVLVLRWWSWWDEKVVAIWVGNERLWPKPAVDPHYDTGFIPSGASPDAEVLPPIPVVTRRDQK